METIKKILNLFLRKIKREKSFSFFIVFLIIIYIAFNLLSKSYLIEIPKEGGEIHEIIIGEKPRFINPVLETKDIDKVLNSLIYTPLFIKNSQGDLIENIATFKVDETGLKYTIKLKNGIYFHDGEKMDIDDVIFTIQQIQNPANNSFYRPGWSGVDLTKIDNQTLELNLTKENYYFKNSLELYILPKHIWENIEYFNLDEKNINAIGSGPFKIQNIEWKNGEKNKKINSITLSKNENYFRGKIFIDNITFHFFDSKEDFMDSPLYNVTDKNINIFNYDAILDNNKNYKKNKINEPIDFNLTIRNKNSNKFLNNRKIRKYIFKVWKSDSKEIDILKKEILKDKDFIFDKENNLLKYKKEIISFSAITGKNEDESLIDISEKLKRKLRRSGIVLNLQKLDAESFITKIRLRKFESVISGSYNEERSWFYYYHSSQKNDPWINIAQFNSLKIDTILIDLRKNLDIKKRKKKIAELKKELENYSLILNLEKSQSYYYTTKDIQNFDLKNITSNLKRFKNIQNWVVETEKILPFFKNQ